MPDEKWHFSDPVPTGPLGPQGAFVVDREKSPENTERTGYISIPSTRYAEPEMRQIVDALEHPHKKPDWWSVAPSVGAALFFALKILVEKDWKPEGLDLFGVLFGASVAIGALANALKQQFSRSVFHERALEYAKKIEFVQAKPSPKA